MKKILHLLFTALLLLGFGSLAAAQSSGPTKVVYHIDDAETQGLKGLRNIRNHLGSSDSGSISHFYLSLTYLLCVSRTKSTS